MLYRFLFLLPVSLFLFQSCGSDKKTSLKKEPFQPNILWISVEDISPYLSMYGDSTISTPNIDKIARGGMVYTRAFTCAGVCAPSRSSIITGMHPETLGTMHMRTALDYFGISKEEYGLDYGLKDPEGNNVPQYSAVIPGEVKVFTEYMRREGYFCANNPKTDYQFAPPMTAWDECGLEGHWRHRKEGEPFFFVRNLHVTHESQIWAKKEDSLQVNLQSVPIPIHFPENRLIRQDVARNYSNIKEMDAQVGEILSQLEEDGLMDSTIIFFWSDHGGPLPRGKREIYDTGLHVPLIIKAPKQWQGVVFGTLLSDEDIHYDDQMISMIDLAPTVISLADIKPPSYMQGRAFLGKYKSVDQRECIFAGRHRLDFQYDEVKIVRDKDYLFVRNYHTELPNYMPIAYRTQMDMMNELLRLNEAGELTERERIWFNPTKPVEEFYVVAEDPLQLNNLIADERYNSDISRMRNALEEWQASLNDRSVLIESEMVKEMWPDFIQPVTAAPEVLMGEGVIEIKCQTKDASIAYQLSDKEIADPNVWDDWLVYQKPVFKSSAQYLHTRAIRIGYKHSAVTTVALPK